MACLMCRERKVKCDITKHFPCNTCVKYNLTCVKPTYDKRKNRASGFFEGRLKLLENRNQSVVSYLEAILSVMKNPVDIDSKNDTEELLSEKLETLRNDSLKLLKNEKQNTSNGHIEKKRKYANEAIEKDEIIKKVEDEQFFNGKGPVPTGTYIGESNLGNSHKFMNGSTVSVDLNEKYPTPQSFKSIDKPLLSVFGPTSVFDNITLRSSSSNGIESINTLNSDPRVIHYIKLFFVWQYPDINMFVFREVFLLDFFHVKQDSSYCSPELVFAICSFGSLLAEEEENPKSISLYFYEKAKELCFRHYSKPSISTLQAFLLLGLYDIYSGHNDGGWALIGMGIRMGYSIGLHLQDSTVPNEDGNTKGELGSKMKRRIFWGTCLVDHVIGVLLGRPITLRRNNSELEESIELPDIEWINEYSFDADHNEFKVGDSLRESIGLMTITENMFTDIFRSGNESKFYEKLQLVNDYNIKIIQWKHRLPVNLSWDAKDLLNSGGEPTKVTFKLLYYIIILCLNRPFLKIEFSNKLDEYRATIKKICVNAVNDLAILVKNFAKEYGYLKCSPLMIYCCIISISVIQRLESEDPATNQFYKNPKTKYKLLLFLKTLKESSSIWGLSEKAFKLLGDSIVATSKLNLEYELQNFDEFETEIVPETNLLNSTVSTPENIYDSTTNGLFNKSFFDALSGDAIVDPKIDIPSTMFYPLEMILSENHNDLFEYEI